MAILIGAGCDGRSRVEKLIDFLAQEGSLNDAQCQPLDYDQNECAAIIRAVASKPISNTYPPTELPTEAFGEITPEDEKNLQEAGIPDNEIIAIRDRLPNERFANLIDQYRGTDAAELTKTNTLIDLAFAGARFKETALPIIRGYLADPKRKGSGETAVRLLGLLDDREAIPLLEKIAESHEYPIYVMEVSVAVLCKFGDEKLPEILLNKPSLAEHCNPNNYNTKFNDPAKWSKLIEEMFKKEPSNRVYYSTPGDNVGIGAFASSLLLKHARKLDGKDAARLARAGLVSHPENYFLQRNIFETIKLLPDSPELTGLLEDMALFDKYGPAAHNFAYTEIARRGLNGTLSYVASVVFAFDFIPLFGGVSDVMFTNHNYITETPGAIKYTFPYLSKIVESDKTPREKRADIMSLLSLNALNNKETTDFFASVMDDPESVIRRLAAEALVARGEIETLKSKLNSDRPEVRKSVIWALEVYDNKETAYSILAESAKNDKDESVRDAALTVLQRFCRANSEFCVEKLISSK